MSESYRRSNDASGQEVADSTAGASGGGDLDVYRDRAHLIAVLAMHYPAVKSFNDPEEPDWMVVYIETPCGQLSWHIAPGDVSLFHHVGMVAPGEVQWDGHSTPEKFERMRELTR